MEDTLVTDIARLLTKFILLQEVTRMTMTTPVGTMTTNHSLPHP